MATEKAAKKWIQGADDTMEKKGTKGKFGKATESKIASAKKAGGKRKQEAVFAENMKKIAAKRKKSGAKKAPAKKSTAKKSAAKKSPAK